MKEAMYYEPLAQGRVLCTLCALYCQIAPGRRGACGVRVNVDETLYTLVYDRVVAQHVDPIEKKPLFHFYPGSRSYSIATAGCNFRCLHCQNSDISQQPKVKLPPVREADAAPSKAPGLSLHELAARIPGEVVTPEAIVEAAVSSNCRSISYTYTEPTIFFELAYDTARLAAAEGVANVFVTNGFISEEALQTIAPYLDAANIDLKSFDDRSHKRMTGTRLQPVLDSIRAYHRLGIWIEVTTLVIPGHTDADTDLQPIADFLCSVSPDIPWHVTRFHPTYRFLHHEATAAAALRHARDIGYRAGLRYVYVGNLPDQRGERTHCHVCQELLVDRYARTVPRNYIRDGCCPRCGERVPGVGLSAVDPTPRQRTPHSAEP